MCVNVSGNVLVNVSTVCRKVCVVCECVGECVCLCQICFCMCVCACAYKCMYGTVVNADFVTELHVLHFKCVQALGLKGVYCKLCQRHLAVLDDQVFTNELEGVMVY